jgi:hypothetical protein
MSGRVLPGVSCMGGQCADRERCKHYHAENRSEPVERLCAHGDDDQYLPVRFLSTVGTWERQYAALLAPATPWDALA